MSRSIFGAALLAAVSLSLTTAGVSRASGGSIGNSIVVGSSVLPLYAVKGDAQVSGVAFDLSGGYLSAYDQAGRQLWSVATRGTDLFGGFDFDRDGWPDAGVVMATPTSQLCGSEVMNETSLIYFSGRTGASFAPVAPLLDKCWSFAGFAPYATSQWTGLNTLFGSGSSDLFLSPYYASLGSYFDFSNGTFRTESDLLYPSTPAYDSEYNAARPTIGASGMDDTPDSHLANGLITTVSGQPRLVFWTSGRVVQYAISPLSSGQLVADTPYLSNANTGLAGRNYGLVSVDPNDPSHIALIAGTSTFSVWNDLRNGTLGSDGCGGIERHVSLYNAARPAVTDVFYGVAPETPGSSCSQNPSQSTNYSNYVVYPPDPWVETRPGQPSRLAYNVYGTDGRWHLHITEPGSLTDQYVLSDVFLWDIRDVTGGGTRDWIISPTGDAPGSYFPERTTNLYTWDESDRALTETKSYPGLIPWLASSFRTAGTSTTADGLYPVLYTTQSGTRELVMMNSSNGLTLAAP